MQKSAISVSPEHLQESRIWPKWWPIMWPRGGIGHLNCCWILNIMMEQVRRILRVFG